MTFLSPGCSCSMPRLSRETAAWTIPILYLTSCERGHSDNGKKWHNDIICFFGRTLDLTIHYSLKMLILMMHAFAPAICVIIPRNHGRVETLPQLPHRVFAERHILILRPSRRQGRAQNNCSYENHFWWIFISTTRRWRMEYKDYFWAQTLCCGNVKIKMSVRLCYNKSFELWSRFRIIWQRWRRSIPWISSSEFFFEPDYFEK